MPACALVHVSGLAALNPGASLEPFEYELETGPGEVLIRVSHCGICHSDVHLVDGDWGRQGFPLVPGHEVIGTVEEIGAGVDTLEVGDRVGLGWQCGACHTCDYCLRGDQNLCSKNRATAMSYGGFADLVKAEAPLVFKIPDSLSSAQTAPMLCGGITTYSPIRRLAARKSRVGIVGLGGLGHLGVQWAAAMGHHVTVFSHSKDKEDHALDLGAGTFVDSTQPKDIADAKCDLIVQTANVDLDWGAYLAALRPNGTLCFVGVPPSPLQLGVGQLLGGQKSITASAIGGASLMTEMLDFAAKHNVESIIETRPMADANAALDRTRQGKARLRMVLEA